MRGLRGRWLPWFVESGVALRFPPQSMTRWRAGRSHRVICTSWVGVGKAAEGYRSSRRWRADQDGGCVRMTSGLLNFQKIFEPPYVGCYEDRVLV